MTKLLSIASLILMLILFPPAALALVSNDAVPGDTTYPIKITLENMIYAVASVNPVSKAWFSAARSDRRFKEIKTLIAQGKSATDTLQQLITQTSITAHQIDSVENPVEKTKLIAQLQTSIKEYNQGLSKFTQPVSNQVLSSPSPKITISDLPLSPAPVTTQRPTPSPASSLIPASTVQPTSQPTPQPPVSDPIDAQQQQVQDTIDKLNDISNQLNDRKQPEQATPEQSPVLEIKTQVNTDDEKDGDKKKDQKNEDSHDKQNDDDKKKDQKPPKGNSKGSGDKKDKD